LSARAIHALIISASMTAMSPACGRADELGEMVRDLNEMQYRVGIGDRAAEANIKKRFEQIEKMFEKLGPAEWKNGRNVRLAATYLLCGGSPGVLRRLYEDHVATDDGAPLLEASLAHAEGRKVEAAKLLARIDAESYSPTVSGHVALVQGSLQIGADNSRAVALFDLARLVMPGSLVEEASLRRELPILDAAGETDRYLVLARRYVQKYAKSPFAGNFWEQLTAAILKAALNLDASRLSEFEELFESAGSQRRFDLHAALVRKGILNGRLTLATAQIEKARALADSPRARERLSLYAAAIMAESGAIGDSLAELKKIGKATLEPADRELMKVVSGVGARLADTPQRQDDITAQGAIATKTEAIAESPLILEIRQSLADSETLLKRAAAR